MYTEETHSEETLEREQFTFYRSFWESIRLLPQKDQLPALAAVIEYGLSGKRPEGLSNGQMAVYILIEPNLKASRRKAKNGKQKGKKRVADSKQVESKQEANRKQTESKPEATANKKEKEIEKENEIEKELENECYKKNIKKKFVKPTVAEVAAYCRDRGYGVNPEKFVAFYESKGWVIGKSPMKDWQAAVRTWAADGQTGKTGKEPGRRRLDADEMAAINRLLREDVDGK